ncbi:MAG: hypothetical protein U1F37_00090 [Alphaproteobacteria bacterium]
MPNPDAVSPPYSCYRLLALKGAGVAPRVMEYFAKRDLVPERFVMRAGAEILAIEVDVAGLDEAAAGHIARCLANIAEVERVALTRKPESLRASA